MSAQKSLLIALAALMVLNCSAVKSPPKVPRKLTAEEYVRAGHLSLQQGDWEQAAFSFHRAMQTDPGYAPAYAGAAYVLATREQPDKAIKYAEKAVSLDARSFDAQFYRGRVLLITKPENWFERTISSFDAALKMKSRHEETLYYKAEAYREHGDLENAKIIFTKIYDMGGDLASQAHEHITYLEAYIAASPKTDIGADMLLVNSVTRADIAALLAAEFNIVQVMQRRNPNYAGGSNQQWKAEENKRIDMANRLSDISGHWAEPWIRDVVQVAAMDAYPDNSFRPGQVVQRMDMALMLQNIIIQSTGNTSLYTAFLNTASRFSDVPHTHYAYNAVCLVTEYNIMSNSGDHFDFDAPVSGMQAVLALKNLLRYLDHSF